MIRRVPKCGALNSAHHIARNPQLDAVEIAFPAALTTAEAVKLPSGMFNGILRTFHDRVARRVLASSYKPDAR